MSGIMVLIHGRHLEADGWERVIWGDPKNGIFGQASLGVALALKLGAQAIYWGSGASEKDGLKESQCAFMHAVAHGSSLSALEGFDPYEIESILKEKSILDLTTQNTEEEITGALEKCQQLGIKRLYLVSAPTHISRCALLVEQLREQGKAGGIDIYTKASDVPYIGYTVQDVVVVEPPQRGDVPKWQTFRYVQAMFGIMHKSDAAFASFLSELGALLRKYNVRVDWEPRA